MAAPVVYRQLLRLARELDRNPMSKALVVASPQEIFDRRVRQVVALPEVDGAMAECASLLGQFNSADGQAEFYAPARSAVEAVRRGRHSPLVNDPMDVGLAAPRALGVAVQGGEALQPLLSSWPPLDVSRPRRMTMPPTTSAASESRERKPAIAPPMPKKAAIELIASDRWWCALATMVLE